MVVIRYGVIVQMTRHADLGPTKHLPFSQNSPAFARPHGKLPKALCEFLATGSSFHLELPVPGLTTIVSKAQKDKFFRLLPSPLGVPARKTAKFDAASLPLGYFQAKTL